MKHYLLKNQQQAGGGPWTDLFIITAVDDFTETVDDTDQVIVLTALAKGDRVEASVQMDVKTNVAGLTTANASVGVTADVVRLVANSNLLAAGDEHYATTGATLNAYVATAATNLVLNADPGANAENLNEATAGEVWVWACISRAADRLTNRQA